MSIQHMPDPGVNGGSEASHLLQRNSNSLRQPLYSGAERDVSFRDNAARTPLGSAAPSPMLQQQLSRRFGVKPPAPLEKPEDMKSRVWLYALLGVVGYLCTGVIVYSTVSGMGVLDALYFCVVTLTTVGYGDLSAHKTGTKIFACFYILVGVAMVGAFLAQLVEMLLNRQEQMLLMIVDELADMTDEQEATNANTASNGLGQSRSGSSKIKRARVKVWSGVIWFFVLVLSGALIFMFAEHLSLVDALYLTVVSASTVGYGDYYPDKTVTKAFAIFFLPLTTLLLAKIVSDYTQMRVESSTQARQHRILHATITTPIFMEMDRDGDGCIDKFEFLCRQLVAQEKVEQEDIDEVMKRFNELDRNNDGTIERDEVANPAHTAINVNVT